MLKKLAAVGLCAAMSVTALSGCGKKTANISSDNIEKGEIAYPIKTDVTLKYWVRLPAALGTSVKNFGETDFAKEYMKRTGINVEYTHILPRDRKPRCLICLSLREICRISSKRIGFRGSPIR